MRVLAAVLLVLYAALVARLTLTDPAVGWFLFERLYALPLTTSHAEVLGNIALFVPAGFLMGIVLGRPLLAAVLCVLAAACIELAQLRYLPSRVPDVADLEHNSLGALLGAACAGGLLGARRLVAH